MGDGKLRRIGADQRYDEQGEAGEEGLPERIGNERKAGVDRHLVSGEQAPEGDPADDDEGGRDHQRLALRSHVLRSLRAGCDVRGPDWSS